MERDEPDELQEVSVVVVEEEAPAPKETALSRSESAQLQLLEEEGRHREATSGNCDWLIDMNTAKFNSLLKRMFLFLVLTTLPTLVIYYLEFHVYVYHIYEFEKILWLFGVFRDGLDITIALLAVLFALCVDVERSDLKPHPALRWMVRLTERAGHIIKEYYYKTTTQLLPPYRAALRQLFRDVVAWLKK